ncbi:MAG TPA: hypothetical protein VIQ30_15285 [Pseudonocardia sp.]
MAVVEHPWPERMTWFWHGHFATSVSKFTSTQLMHSQNETVRTRPVRRPPRPGPTIRDRRPCWPPGRTVLPLLA